MNHLTRRSLLISFALALPLAALTLVALTPNFITIDFPGATFTAAHGINSAGDIVGLYQDGTRGVIHGFELRKGTFRTIDFPGSIFTESSGLALMVTTSWETTKTNSSYSMGSRCERRLSPRLTSLELSQRCLKALTRRVSSLEYTMTLVLWTHD